MVKFISFHSLKGGSGKTTLATNFAVLTALSGQNVCVLDFDFRAPSLHVFFKANPHLWLNDFLNDKCRITETLHEIDVKNTGKLVVGFANPSTESMRDMMTKDREWEAKALRHLLSAKSIFLKEGFDVVVFDTSPGVQYSSVNALAASNLVVLVMNMDELNRKDVVNVVNKLYKPLGRKIGIVLNKVLVCLPEERFKNTKMAKVKLVQLAESVEHKLRCPLWGLIPCFCEVLMGGNIVHALQKPDHPFVTELSAVADNIRKNLNS